MSGDYILPADCRDRAECERKGACLYLGCSARRVTPADYAEYRSANKRVGSYAEVKAFVEERDRIPEAKPIDPRLAKVLRQRRDATMSKLDW